jgi:putative DNA primase/helicase
MRDSMSAALAYAKRGWAVFPLNGKKPYTSHGYHDATCDSKQIRAWYAKWPTMNIGIACDSQRGPVVIDIDGPSAITFLDGIDIPSTREATSGRKTKRHLYFDPSLESEEIRRLIRPFRDAHGAKITLDILGDGGYVVAPPSRHPETGRRYAWVSKRPLAPFPDALLRLLRSEKKMRHTAAPELPQYIGEGERDQLLTSLAGTMRRRGASPSAILAALREENTTRVRPPLPDKDLHRIATSIGAKDPAVISEHMTDLGNARRFITQHDGEVRAIMSARRPWYTWDDKRWTPDQTGEVERMAKTTVRRIYTEASKIPDEEQRDALLKHAAKSESAPRIRGMLELAATEPELSTTIEMLDANRWLLNVNNGTIDLKTGALRPHKRKDLITRLAPIVYDDSAQCPRWDAFLLEVMNGDPDLVHFLQLAVGYSLTGDIREECLFFLYGQGSNGKSTFLEILRSLFGEYAKQSDFNTFLAARGDGPRNDIARMHGARLVTASEADSEKGFDGKTIKLLTGGDTIVARKLYEEHKEFKPQHKLWLAANHKPIVKEQTEGFWRRMRIVPFTVSFNANTRDKQLAKRLTNELPGILNWAIAGCLDWKKHGLVEPAAIRKATRTYRDENDLLGEFIAQSCSVDPTAWTSTPLLYRAFIDWWADTRGPRSQPISLGWFTRLLGERGDLRPAKRHHARGWVGLAVKESASALTRG